MSHDHSGTLSMLYQCKQEALLRWSPHCTRASSDGYKQDQRFLLVDRQRGEVVILHNRCRLGVISEQVTLWRHT